MFRAACLLVGAATVVAVVDLTHKATATNGLLHERTAAYAIAVAGGSVAWSAAIVLTASPAISFAGGIVLGGAVANLVSLLLWHGVPDPLVVSAVAFNLADLFVLGGFIAVATSTLAFARANRERLREPVLLRSGAS